MPSATYSLRANLWSTLTRFKRPDVPIPVALRNTVAVIAPLAAGFASGHVLAGVGVSAGALNVMFADQPGPYLQRLTLIALVTLGATLSGLIGFWAGSYPHLLPVVYALWGFCGGILVLFGVRMTRVGMTSMILLVVATSTPMPLHEALAASLLILAGGALQALLSVAAWPLRRYRPERQALAAVYHDLARLVREQPAADDAPPMSQTLTTLQQTLLGRQHLRSRALEAFHTLLELAERMRLELVAWSETDADTEAHKSYRIAAARVLDRIALALERAEPPSAANKALLRLQALHADPTGPAGISRFHAQALTGQIAAAVRNANWAGSQGEIRARKEDIRLPSALRNVAPLATLRANIGFSSVAFRHAVRLAIVLALAGLIAHALGVGHAYWLPMTCAIVLRPDFGSTFNTGLLRMLGTIAGLILTTVLLYLTPQNEWAHLALMGVLCFAFRYLATAHYGVAVAALTGTVVILLSFDGIPAAAAANERVIQTVLGCLLSLLAYLAWPTWERDRVRPALARMLDSYADYLDTLARHDTDTDTIRREARTAARAARSNAQASVERLRAEPATRAGVPELATALFASANRLVRTSMAWESLLDDDTPLPCAETAEHFMRDAAVHIHALAQAIRDNTPPPPQPPLRDRQQTLALALQASDDDTAQLLLLLSDRLTDNIDTLTHVLEKAA